MTDPASSGVSTNPTPARKALTSTSGFSPGSRRRYSFRISALAEHDRGVRLLDGQPPLPHSDGGESGLAARHELTDALFAPDRVGQGNPQALAVCRIMTVDQRNEVALRTLVVIEGRLEDDQRARPERRAIDLGHRGDRPLLRAEPAPGRQVGGRHPDAVTGQSIRNRTIGHGTPPSTQSWSGTSITRPLCS